MLCPKPWDTQCRLPELCNVKLVLLHTCFPVHMVLNKHMAEPSHLPWCNSQWPYHVHWDTIHLIRCHPNSQEKNQHVHSLVFMSNLVSLSKIQAEWCSWWSLGIYLLMIHSSARKPESSEKLCCPEEKRRWVGGGKWNLKIFLEASWQDFLGLLVLICDESAPCLWQFPHRSWRHLEEETVEHIISLDDLFENMKGFKKWFLWNLLDTCLKMSCLIPFATLRKGPPPCLYLKTTCLLHIGTHNPDVKICSPVYLPR